MSLSLNNPNFVNTHGPRAPGSPQTYSYEQIRESASSPAKASDAISNPATLAQAELRFNSTRRNKFPHGY